MTLQNISSAGTHDAPVPALRESHGVTTSAQAATVRGALFQTVSATMSGVSFRSRYAAPDFMRDGIAVALGQASQGRIMTNSGFDSLSRSNFQSHRHRQGGYCGPCLHNSMGTKKNKMRKTNLGTMNQVPWERVEVPQGSLLTALAWQTLFTQGIAQPRASIDKRLVIASKSDPTAGGQSRQAHSPLRLRQSVYST